MIADKKEFYGGIGMLMGFVVVLVVVFSPILNGKNGLQYLDSLYNSISKGSAYYIQDIKKQSDRFKGNSVSVTIDLADGTQAEQTARLFAAGGAKAVVAGARLEVTGDLGGIMDKCLVDSDYMYRNKGKMVSDKYGYDERQVLFNWWNSLSAMDKDLNNQKKYKEAKVISLVKKKAVETSYNYYGIEPQKITDRLGVVIFSLLFYVLYTLWYGFGIMFMFEGWGLKLAH